MSLNATKHAHTKNKPGHREQQIHDDTPPSTCACTQAQISQTSRPWFEQRWVANDGYEDDVLEGKVEHEAGWREMLKPRT